jgi:sterol desaturase/sphingolipid hydroxylase (fatty acid hydroxylase superfamily)
VKAVKVTLPLLRYNECHCISLYLHLMDEIKRDINSVWGTISDRFTFENSRLYWVYLLSSLILALIVLGYVSYRKHGKIKPLLVIQELFDSKIWFHKSALVDYKIFIGNSIILGLAIVPFFVSALLVMDGMKNQMVIWFGEPDITLRADVWVVLFYTIVLWLVSDFSRFLLHFLLHKIPFLWRIHEVHHSAEVLTPMTQYRMHPIEMLLFYFRGVFVIGVISGVFLYYYPFQFGYIEIFGVNVFRFAFLLVGSNLRHSHVPMRYPTIVEFIFISPYQHQIHHSVEKKHFDKNYGSHLAIWDWLFGSLVRSKETEKIEFGIPNGNPHKSLFQAYFTPFVRIFKGKKV